MMGLDDSPLMKSITGTINLVIKFFDNAYNEGWLLYLIGGLIIFAVYVLFLN